MLGEAVNCSTTQETSSTAAAQDPKVVLFTNCGADPQNQSAARTLRRPFFPGLRMTSMSPTIWGRTTPSSASTSLRCCGCRLCHHFQKLRSRSLRFFPESGGWKFEVRARAIHAPTQGGRPLLLRIPASTYPAACSNRPQAETRSNQPPPRSLELSIMAAWRYHSGASSSLPCAAALTEVPCVS